MIAAGIVCADCKLMMIGTLLFGMALGIPFGVLACAVEWSRK